MTTRRQQRILKEARIQSHIGRTALLAEKITAYQRHVLNEGFFDKVKQIGQGISTGAKALGREYVPGFKGAGGASTQDLDAELPEMKALQQSLTLVNNAKSKLLNFKLSDLDGLDVALDSYVQTLIDLFTEFKDVSENPEKSSALPEVSIKITDAFKEGRALIAGFKRALDDGRHRLMAGIGGRDSTVAKGSFALPAPRRGVPGVDNAKASRGDMGASSAAVGRSGQAATGNTAGALRGAGQMTEARRRRALLTRRF